MRTLTTTVARVLFAVPFAIFGLFHFMGASQMAGMVPLPGGVFWVYFTGAALIAAAIAIMFNIMGKLASLLLALMLLIFILSIHLPGVIGAADQQAMQQSMMSLLKDMGLMAGALTYAGIFASEVPERKVA